MTCKEHKRADIQQGIFYFMPSVCTVYKSKKELIPLTMEIVCSSIPAKLLRAGQAKATDADLLIRIDLMGKGAEASSYHGFPGTFFLKATDFSEYTPKRFDPPTPLSGILPLAWEISLREFLQG